MESLDRHVALLAHEYPEDAEQGVQREVLGVLCDGSCPREHVFVRLCDEFTQGRDDDPDSQREDSSASMVRGGTVRGFSSSL